MLYLHDVWVNFFEGEENGYNVCGFHEWKKTDDVQLMDTIPLLKVTPELYDFIENDLLDVQQNLLDAVKNKAYLRRNHERINLPYAFVITDGSGILAVETLGYKVPMRKSRLIPRQEQVVLEMVQDRDVDFTLPEDIKRDKSYYLLSPAPTLMIGLTRRERQLKQLLFMCLDDLEVNRNEGFLKYIYAEWNIKNYINVKDLEFDDLFKQLYNEVKDGWTKEHHEICKVIVKGQPFYEKVYELESA